MHSKWLFIQDFWVAAHCSIFMNCECPEILSKLLLSMSFALSRKTYQSFCRAMESNFFNA